MKQNYVNIVVRNKLVDLDLRNHITNKNVDVNFFKMLNKIEE